MARRFNVTRACFSNWITRHPPDGDDLPTPEPDAFMDGRPIWLEDSWYKWERWKHRLDLDKIQRYHIDLSPELFD